RRVLPHVQRLAGLRRLVCHALPDSSPDRALGRPGGGPAAATEDERGRLMLRRAIIVAVCLLVGAGALVRASKTERVPVRESFENCPNEIGGWEGKSLGNFDAKILSVLGVDEYMNRVYASPGRPPVGLYVGYYQSQRQGDTMHSPLNCLPGAGWLPISQKRTEIRVTDDHGPPTVLVNDFIIQQGLDQQVALYW